MRIKTYQKIYIWTIFLIPILYQYSLPGGIIDFDVVAMIFIFLLTIIGRIKSQNNCCHEFMILMVYVVLCTACNLFFGYHYSDTFSIIMRAGRFCLYLYIVLIRNVDLFDYDYAMKTYKKIVYLATIYIIIQTVFYYGAGITLPNRIGTSSVVSASGQEIGRLRGFFSEPAAMAYALVPYVVCNLFETNEELENSSFRDAIVGTIGIVLTTSGQGVLCIAIVWGIWLFRSMVKGKISKKNLVFIIIAIISIVYLSKSPIISFTFGRVADTSSTGAVSARKSGYVTLQLLNFFQLLFGTGYGNYVTENIYGLNVPYRFVNYSSIAEAFFTTGIVGSFLLVKPIFSRFIYSNERIKVLIVALFILSLGGCPLTGNYFPIYLSLIFCNPINNSVTVR